MSPHYYTLSCLPSFCTIYLCVHKYTGLTLSKHNNKNKKKRQRNNIYIWKRVNKNNAQNLGIKIMSTNDKWFITRSFFRIFMSAVCFIFLLKFICVRDCTYVQTKYIITHLIYTHRRWHNYFVVGRSTMTWQLIINLFLVVIVIFQYRCLCLILIINYITS